MYKYLANCVASETVQLSNLPRRLGLGNEQLFWGRNDEEGASFVAFAFGMELFVSGVSMAFLFVSSITFTSLSSDVLEFTLNVNIYKHICDSCG